MAPSVLYPGRPSVRRLSEEMMKHFAYSVALAGLVALAAPLSAQGRERGKEVPPGHRPPPGMCRIWLDDVPAGQQPAPTDCATAVRNRPSNGRVLFGDDYAKPGNVKQFRDDDRRDDRDDRDRDDRDRDDDRFDRQRRYPATMPEMIGAIMIERGRRSDDVTRWLGDAAYQVRYVDRDRDGLPERASWLDENRRTVQVWIDSNRDGRADSVEVYENGRKTRTITPQ